MIKAEMICPLAHNVHFLGTLLPAAVLYTRHRHMFDLEDF